MKLYVYQKFLLANPYDGVKMEAIPFFQGNIDSVLDVEMPYTLFDVNKEYIRKVDVEYLDNCIDTECEWNIFAQKIVELDEIVLVCDSNKSTNPIISKYRECTVKAYVYLVKNVSEKLKVFLFFR